MIRKNRWSYELSCYMRQSQFHGCPLMASWYLTVMGMIRMPAISSMYCWQERGKGRMPESILMGMGLTPVSTPSNETCKK